MDEQGMWGLGMAILLFYGLWALGYALWAVLAIWRQIDCRWRKVDARIAQWFSSDTGEAGQG